MEIKSDHRLTKKEYIILGSMLFGLFFGAGNLIFRFTSGKSPGATGSRPPSASCSPPSSCPCARF